MIKGVIKWIFSTGNSDFIGVAHLEIRLKTCIFEVVSISDRSGRMGDRSSQKDRPGVGVDRSPSLLNK